MSSKLSSVSFPLIGLGAVGLMVMILRPKTARAADDPARNWKPARLTEYYPDLPGSASPAQKLQEGGPYARDKTIPIITLDQHRADPEKYPFVTVAADTNLEGRTLKVGFGPRVYFAAFPNDTFRIYDTGGNFRGTNKKPGQGEPFDIALSYSGLRGSIGRILTGYDIDWSDVLAFPTRLRRIPNA